MGTRVAVCGRCHLVWFAWGLTVSQGDGSVLHLLLCERVLPFPQETPQGSEALLLRGLGGGHQVPAQGTQVRLVQAGSGSSGLEGPASCFGKGGLSPVDPHTPGKPLPGGLLPAS